MNVLFTNHTGLVGGAEHSLIELLRATSPDVSGALACPAGPLVARAARTVPVRTVPPATASFGLDPVETPRAVAQLARQGGATRRAAYRHGADLVHANSIRAGLAAALAGGPPLVVHARDLLPDAALSTPIRALVIRRAAGVVAISRTVAAQWASLPVAVIDNAVDLDRFVLGSARSREAASPRVAMVAQIAAWKRQHDAIAAIAALRDRGRPVGLTIVGSVKFTGPTTHGNAAYGERLRTLVREQRLGELVHFAGERDDVPELLAGHDALLLPSEREPFGRAAAEAIACGVPVVGSNDAGVAEIVEPGVTGLLHPVGDIRAITDAIELALDRDWDGAAFATARERFSPRRHADAIAAVWRAAL